MRFFKHEKLFFGILLLFGLILCSIKPAKAAYDAGGIAGYKSALEAPEINRPSWTLGILGDTANGLTRMLVGYPKLEGELEANAGAAGVFAHLINGMYQNKPVSSGRYFAYLGQQFSLAKPAYAQGKGWSFLEPVMSIWKGVRNATYLIFVVIFVAVGFMIMFRKKIDPQTVISVQNALPRVVVALILVTFSYAICGLIVDISFLIAGLFEAIFTPVLAEGATTLGGTVLFNWEPSLTIFHYLPEMVRNIGSLTGAGIGNNLVGGIFGLIANAIGDFVNGDFAGIFYLIFAFMLVSSIIKIFLSLLSRYVMIFLYTLASPFLFAWGSLPGQSDHTGRLFKSLLGAVLTFPVVFFLLQLAAFFVKVGNQIFTFRPLPPFDVPGGNFSQAISGFVGLGIIMATSKIPETIDDLLQVKSVTGPTLGAETASALRRIPIIGGLMG